MKRHLGVVRIAALCGSAVLLCPGPARGAEIVFSQPEVLGYDWPRHLLAYPVEFEPGQARAGALSLWNAEGVETPLQVDVTDWHADGSIREAAVRFYAALPADGRLHFTLKTRAGAKARPDVTPVSVKTTRDALILGNGHTAVRLPGGRTEHPEPIPLAEAPGPIQGFRMAHGEWVGGSRFLAGGAPESTAVRLIETEVIASGPLAAEAMVRYELAGGGHFEVRVRLEAEAPMIFVSEEAATGLIRSPVLSVEYLLGSREKDGWRPDVVYARAGRPLPQSDAGLEAELAKAGVALAEAGKGLQRVSAIDSSDASRELFGLNVAHRWTTAPIFAAFLRRADLKASVRTFVGVVPLHAGRWRNAQSSAGLEPKIIAGPRRQVAFRAPLTAPPRRDSYMHTGEYDNTLPPDVVRRVWGIMVGPTPESMQALWDARVDLGYVTLDDYKDWRLDWPEDPGVTYPRLFFTARDLAAARENVERNPFRDALSALPYGKNDPALANRLADKAVKGARFAGRGYAWHLLFRGGYMGLPWISGFHQSNYAVRFTVPAEQALSCEGLDPARKKRLRAVLAACAHAASEPDLNRRGCGVHQGNPNMPIRRFLALPHIAALIPDHPRAKEWLDVSAQFMRWKLQTMVAPKGDWGEPGRYYNASLPYFLQAAIILENAGALRPETARRCGAVAYAHSGFLTPPDPRFDGARIVPSLGHGSQIDYHYAFADAVMLRNREPEMTRELAWVWNAMGRPDDKNARSGQREGYDIYPLLLPVFGRLAGGLGADYRPPDLLRSAWHPGWGAVFRAHAGDADETYMAYRQGYMVSHADPNQGDFVIHAKGAPLTPSSSAHYLLHIADRGDWGGPKGLHATKGDIFCRVRFGTPDRYGGQPGGGPESNVNEFHAGKSVDYLRGWGDYSGRSRWMGGGTRALPSDRRGAIHWDRQIMFLKGMKAGGPNYFVFRDSFTGNTAQPKYWHLRSAVKPEDISLSKHGFEVRASGGTALNATFLAPERVEATVVSGRDAKTVCTVTQVKAGVDEKEYLVVLYPRRAEEAVPACRRLAPGVLEARTSEGTDYVFLGGENTVRFRNEAISFTGRVGAVRVRPDGIHFVLATADGDGSVAYSGTTYSGPAPFEFVVAKEDLRKGTIKVPAPEYGIDAADPRLKREGDGIVFEGTSGGVEVLKDGHARLVLGPGRGKVGYKGYRAWGEGPFELVTDEAGAYGITEGRERMIYMTRPPDLKGIPALWIDGKGSAPGCQGCLAVPVLSGRHDITIRQAEQPDLFR
jgi:hypothetical protein